MKKNERISINVYKPICKHLQFSITEYHDGYIDEDSRCDITLERCKEKGCKYKWLLCSVRWFFPLHSLIFLSPHRFGADSLFYMSR